MSPTSYLRSTLRRSPALWLWLIVAAGVVFRLRQYLFNRSLWHDELLLASTFADRGFSELIFQPLGNAQAAPLAFLVLVKAITSMFGTHEWSLRLLSLVCGMAALGLALPVAGRLFPSFSARATFVALMAASPVLVYYSSEFKQYQGDVLCTMLVLWLTIRFQPSHHWRDALWLALAGATSVWLSHPVDFVLAGCGLALWVEMARRREWRALMAITAVGVAWLASFAADYALSLSLLPNDGYLSGFWATSFAPIPPTSVGDLQWFGEAALGLVYLGMHQMGTAFREVLPGWFSVPIFALLALTVCGCAALAGQSGRTAAAGALALVAALAASALHLYPFRSRLILFLVPFVFLALAALVQQVHHVSRRWAGQWLAAALAMATVAMPLRLSAHTLVHPNNYQDLRGALQYIATHREPGDHVMLSSWTHHSYNFYAPRTGLGDMPQFEYTPTTNEVHNIRATVRRICLDTRSARTWVVATNQIVADNRHFRAALNNMSPPLFTYPLEGAAVFLHDFRPTAYCQRYRAEAMATSAPAGGSGRP
jgi:Dolichyl-phosphate-mannose-protein mannosyltransferase